MWRTGFQSTLPRGERPDRQGWFRVWLTNFNPRSHEGSDSGDYVASCLAYKFQSTLPRGERRYILYSLSKYRISIHAPTRGATLLSQLCGPMQQNFNPRSHEGSDTVLQGFYFITGYFNPRSHEGSDTTARQPKVNHLQFQSTLPRGERPVGERSNGSSSIISIHAPTRGATAIFAKKFSFLSAKIV